MHFPLLSAIILLPLLGALFLLLFVKEEGEVSNRNIYAMSFWTSLATFLLSLTLLVKFDRHLINFQFEEALVWIEGYNISYHLGVDGLSIFFVILTTLLAPICIVASKGSITHRMKEYMIAFLLLESFIIGTFAALDFVLFYIFFEAMLIPMFLIIGIWGGKDRIYAAFKFFLYTLLGSLLLLLAIIYIYLKAGTTDILVLHDYLPVILSATEQKYLWLALFAAFAVKIPMWPVHTWLPDAHVQAPTAGSVILAGILLKMGGYGFLRFSLPMLPEASVYFADFVFVLSLVAIVYTSIVALMQTDMKKLIAYSSIAHMGYVTLGIFTFNQQGVEGAVFQMISHGLISGALFLCVGILYNQTHSREIKSYGGVASKMPIFAAFFMLFTLASVALPATSGFVGEFLILLGAFKVNVLVAMIATTGVILGAVYMLWLYKRVMFGEVANEIVANLKDVGKRELTYLSVLGVLVILIGIYPSFILEYISVSVSNLIRIY
jgi:NADH-quinone oxidoreductase subunit M